MNVLLAASEAVPFCKTGGLADVAGALTQVLARLGHKVCLFLPGYRSIQTGGTTLKPVPGRFWIPIGDVLAPATLSTMEWGAATVVVVNSERYFSREGLYQEQGRDYADNDERFIFFSRAVLEGAKLLGFKPDVVHAHDWQTALAPAYLRTTYRLDAFYARAACVLTVHNIAYQGLFTKDALFLAGFGWADFTPDKLEYYGGVNFLKAGLVYADIITTVSPTYSREIQSSADFGRGLEGLLRHRAQDLRGILNGLDTESWNPETDPALARNYGREDAREGKAANKAALLKECGLAPKPKGPLLGVVSRLDAQKGLDTLVALVPGLADKGAKLAVLGSGDPELQAAFAGLAERFPGVVHFDSSFNEPLARRIYAGSDLFLMPSRFEPCGLAQMAAMAYGSLPVVNSTGGLADTVFEEGPGGRSNGFVAAGADPEAYGAALHRALGLYADPQAWRARVAAAMSGDYSWDRSAKAYVAAYGEALARAASASS